MKILKVVLTLALAVLMLSSCTAGLDKLEYDKTTNEYINGKTGIKYTDAPSRYEAVTVGEMYAKWKNPMTTVVFHEMEGVDPEKWMTEPGKVLFYAEGEKLPEPDEMGINKILVCVEQEVAIALVSIQNEEHISTIIDTWKNAEAVTYPALSPMRNFKVKMVSPDYPWMYYSINYIEYSDGSCYLYSRDDGRCVDAGTLIKDYLDGKIS